MGIHESKSRMGSDSCGGMWLGDVQLLSILSTLAQLELPTLSRNEERTFLTSNFSLTV